MLLSITGNWLVNPPTGIALTDLPSDKVFQRDIGGTSTSVAISGTYTGGTPGAVEAKVVAASGGATVVDWTTVDPAPSGGNWSGSITVPQGGFYNMKVRCSRAHSVNATGSHGWLVGGVIIAYGQSNMGSHLAAAGVPAISAVSGTSVYSHQDGWLPNSTNIVALTGGGTEVYGGDSLRNILNYLKTTTGIPWGLVWHIQGGTPIELLLEGSVSFTALAGYVAAAGGKGEFIMYHQGEANAATTGSAEGDIFPSYYVSYQASLHQSIANLVGRTKAQIPFVLSSLAIVTTTGHTDDTWTRMQQTHVRCEQDNASTYFSHSNYDIPLLPDGLHWLGVNGAGAGVSGQRYARTFSWLLGTDPKRPAWFATAAARVDATHTDVTLVHSMGTDFTPTSGITGFTITGNNGSSWEAATGARQNATTIRLTHSDLGTVQRTVRYDFGQNPDESGMVKDNSAINVPLNFTTYPDLVATGASSLPVPRSEDIIQKNVSIPSASSAKITKCEIGLASSDRYLIVPIVRDDDTVTPTSVTLSVAGQSNVVLTLVRIGGSSRGQHYVAHGAVGAAYGKFADITIQYSGSIFSTPSFFVYTVSRAALNSTTPVTAWASDTDTDAVATLATSAGGFIIAMANQNSGSTTNGTFSGSEGYAERADVAFGNVRRVIADASNTASNAVNSTTITFDATANLSIGLAHWR